MLFTAVLLGGFCRFDAFRIGVGLTRSHPTNGLDVRLPRTRSLLVAQRRRGGVGGEMNVQGKLMLALLIGSTLGTAAHAATFNVTRFADPSGASCSASDCSLRAA